MDYTTVGMTTSPATMDIASSNRSNDNSKKKQKMTTTTNQKTLGVARASNSHTSSSRKTPFSDFDSYMTEKNRKLHNQFNVEASTSSFSGSSSGKPVFAGVSIFVDGFTVPSSQVSCTSFFMFMTLLILIVVISMRGKRG